MKDMNNFNNKVSDVVTPTWLQEAIECGPRKAIRNLNSEPNGFYACGLPDHSFNPRASVARIRKGKLEIDVTYSGIKSDKITCEGKGFDEREWLDVSEATGFIDPYGRSVYAS